MIPSILAASEKTGRGSIVLVTAVRGKGCVTKTDPNFILLFRDHTQPFCNLSHQIFVKDGQLDCRIPTTDLLYMCRVVIYLP